MWFLTLTIAWLENCKQIPQVGTPPSLRTTNLMNSSGLEKVPWKKSQSVNNVLLQSSFTLAGMVLQRLFWCKYLGTARTSIGESVWKMSALNVVAHIGLGWVGEGKADSTTGHSMLIQSYEAIKVLELFYHSWERKRVKVHGFKQQKAHTSEDAFAVLS